MSWLAPVAQPLQDLTDLGDRQRVFDHATRARRVDRFAIGWLNDHGGLVVETLEQARVEFRPRAAPPHRGGIGTAVEQRLGALVGLGFAAKTRQDRLRIAGCAGFTGESYP